MQYNRKGAIVYSAVKARNPIHGLTAIARPYMYKNQTWDFHNNYISPSDIQTKKFVLGSTLIFAQSYYLGYSDPVQQWIYLHSNISHVGQARGSYGGQGSGRYSSLGLQLSPVGLGCSRQCWTPRTFGHRRPRGSGSGGGSFGHGARLTEKSRRGLNFHLISFRFVRAVKTLVAGVINGHLAEVRPGRGLLGLNVSGQVSNRRLPPSCRSFRSRRIATFSRLKKATFTRKAITYNLCKMGCMRIFSGMRGSLQLSKLEDNFATWGHPKARA